MENLILALDFGGTKHTIGTMTLGERNWRTHQRVYSPPGANARYDIETVIRIARGMLEDIQPVAIGVSFGGPVNAEAGIVRLSHHVPGWENTPVKAILEDEFNAPAVVDNDANVAAVGEHRYGAGQGCSSLFYITVSTGVGGGWVLDGKPWRGVDGMAGEIGHTQVDPHGPLCLCGKHGCVERLASGPYMAQDARETLQQYFGINSDLSPEKFPGDKLYRLVNGDLEKITGLVISQAAAQGDVLALQLLERSAWALGVGIGNAANLVNPQRFILGGGVTKSGEYFWQQLRRAARATALPEVSVEVVPAAFEDDAPLWGALALAEDLIKAKTG